MSTLDAANGPSMTEQTDVQHHLEHGLVLLSRGMIFEARQSWRAALRIEPTNSAARDYLASTERELNEYDRRREAEAEQLVAAGTTLSDETWDSDEDTAFVFQPSPEPAEEPLAPSAEDREVVVEALAEEDDEPEEEELWSPVDEVSDAAHPIQGEDAFIGEDSSPAASPPTDESEPGDMSGEEWEPLDWMAEDTPIPAGDDTREEAAPHPEETPLPPTAQEAEERPPVHQEAEEWPPVQEAEAPPEQDTSQVPDPRNILEQTAKLLEERRFAAARKLLQEQVETHPGEVALLEELKRVEQDMQAHYADILGDLDSVPELNVDVEELYSLDLDQVGGYIISLVDGILTLDDIFTLSAQVDRLTVMQVLGDLVSADLVTLHRST